MKATPDFDLEGFVALTPDDDIERWESYQHELERRCEDEQWCRTEFVRLAGWIRDAGGPDFAPFLPTWMHEGKKARRREQWWQTQAQRWAAAFLNAAPLLHELREKAPDARKAARLAAGVVLAATSFETYSWSARVIKSQEHEQTRAEERDPETRLWLDTAEEIQSAQQRRGLPRLKTEAEAIAVRKRTGSKKSDKTIRTRLGKARQQPQP
jgi:hypothetical protein